MRLVIALLAGLWAAAAAAEDRPLRLAMPEDLIARGFDKHLLPRFRFKTRITVEAVPQGAAADMVLAVEAPGGARVFQDMDGAVWRLAPADGPRSDEARAFLAWLRSVPGKAAIEAFPPGGAPLFTTEVAARPVVVEARPDGDAERGARLALVHCGRCHVVDARNRMGGIGSTPSFAALRGRGNWSDLFITFWTANPHPSFTQVEGYTEPFPTERPVHIAPVLMTMDEVEAITAFVATLTPKDLGRPVSAN